MFALVSSDQFNIAIGLASFFIVGAGWVARQIFLALQRWAVALEGRVEKVEDKLNNQKLDLIEIKAYQRGYSDASGAVRLTAPETGPPA